MTLLLPFAAGQPALLQVNQVLIRSILVILRAENDTSTRKIYFIISPCKIPWQNTCNSDYFIVNFIPIIGDSPNGTAVQKIVVDKRIFQSLQFRRHLIYWSRDFINLRYDKLYFIRRSENIRGQKTLETVNLPSLLHWTSTWSGFLHPFGLQICSIRLESKKFLDSESESAP